MGDDPHTWRLGFSKIFLEIAPFVFAEQLLRMGSGATKKMVTEVERVRQLHEPDPSILARVPFLAGQADLVPQIMPMIEEIARFLEDSDHITELEIEGHCDPSDADNADTLQALSQRRADTVKAALVERHVDAKRLVAKGYGADHPTAEGAQEPDMNRRVQFDVLDHKPRVLLDRYVAQHYIRLHTVPLGQWMSMDFANLAKLWNEAPVKDLITALKESAPRLGPQNAQIVEQVVTAISRAKQDQPIATQTGDRGLFEAIAQIIALRRATQPIAIDILERVVMPALHVGIPDKFPPLDEDDLSNLRKGIELFAFFIETVPHKFPADDEGFLGTIPHEQLTTPYADRSVLEVGKGDWVVVNPAHFVPMLTEFEPQKLLDKYDEFVAYIRSLPDAPNRRDDGRMLAETAIRALADLKVCIATAAQNKDALLFRLLPPPG
jgi:outer membrane protein OmpA-like peptidoglycan-associated protein